MQQLRKRACHGSAVVVEETVVKQMIWIEVYPFVTPLKKCYQYLFVVLALFQVDKRHVSNFLYSNLYRCFVKRAVITILKSGKHENNSSLPFYIMFMGTIMMMSLWNQCRCLY